ncbi:MAG: SPOR domain-containing protein, partial [Candidatus Aminicenantes bacterium]|nr:SPOR domain-containing protein [Candidatus Aminicenantes bacterium]
MRVEVLTVPPGLEKGVRYSVQVGAFASRANAESLRRKLAGAFPGVYIEPFVAPTQTY